jgi:hypothetical protein
MKLLRLEIGEDFDLYGQKEGEWENFEKGIEYEAFLAQRDAENHRASQAQETAQLNICNTGILKGVRLLEYLVWFIY